MEHSRTEWLGIFGRESFIYKEDPMSHHHRHRRLLRKEIIDKTMSYTHQIDHPYGSNQKSLKDAMGRDADLEKE